MGKLILGMMQSGMRSNATSLRRGGRSQKWVVSRSLKSVGPNATLVGADVGTFVARLKAVP
jgi:hypothetical protein